MSAATTTQDTTFQNGLTFFLGRVGQTIGGVVLDEGGGRASRGFGEVSMA
jgi:hypothetical protein